MEENSITSLKSSFIRTQVRLLETPLKPSTQWRDLMPSPDDEGVLSAKMITDLVGKVNDKIRQHNRLIFSTQSQHHVAEQIESLHWNLVAADTEHAEIDTVVVRRDAESTDSQTIKSLPEEYEDLFLHPDHQSQDDEPHRYTQLRLELLELNQKRDALQKRLARYKQLKKLIEPFEEPQKNLQPNLVARDGELSQELDRMRVLLARVTGRVKDVGVSPRRHLKTDRTGEFAQQTDQQRLARVMDLD